MSDYVVKKTVQLDAMPDEVWDALTNPEKTKKYFFHCAVYSDWKPGSPIVFKGKIFFIFPIELKGTILEVVPQKLLKYQLVNGKTGTISTVTDMLRVEGKSTILSIMDDVGAGEGASDRYERSMKGWDKILKGLRLLIEGR